MRRCGLGLGGACFSGAIDDRADGERDQQDRDNRDHEKVLCFQSHPVVPPGRSNEIEIACGIAIVRPGRITKLYNLLMPPFCDCK